MKFTATAACMLAATQAQQAPVDTTAQDAALVMEGVILGALSAEMPNLEHCIQDGESLINDIKTATADFKTKNVKKITEGLKVVGHALTTVKTAVSDCKGVEGDFEKLEAMAAIFSNPQSVVIHIGKDLVVHGHDIFKEVKGAISAYDSHDFKNFGYNIGKAAAQIIIGKPDEQFLLDHMNDPVFQQYVRAEAAKHMPKDANREEIAEVMQGFFEAAGLQFNFGNLLICVYEADDAALDLYESAQLVEEAWQNEGIMEKLIPTIGGLTFAFLGIEAFISQALPVCEAIDTSEYDFSKINQAFEAFKKDEAKVMIVGEDVVLNGHVVTGDIMGAVDSFHNGKYHDFGTQMGQIAMAASAEENNMYLY